jgi:hypothetical protein
MKNLAGVKGCDAFIRDELKEAGIAVLYLPGEDTTKHEVPWQVMGVLGAQAFMSDLAKYPEEGSIRKCMKASVMDDDVASFRFRRAWYYWMVSGYVPLNVAMEMYADPVGKKDIRVDGHCGCPSPDEYQGRPLIAGQHCINSYHIDSQEGLNLFAATLKKHNLV